MNIKIKKIFLILFLTLFVCSSAYTKYVHAEDLVSTVVVENPTNLSNQSNDIQITGYALASSNIVRVDIYIDGKIVGQATYGQARQDVFNKYPNINNSLNSGYSYKLNSRGYNDGNHEIKVEAVDASSNKISSIVNVGIKNQRTLIMGKSICTKDQMINYFLQNNNIKDFNYINNFVDILLQEAAAEGVRADIAFVQMMKETNFLKFTGGVREWQNNFGGLGATGTVPTDPNVPYGEKFDSIQIGIRAVIQHLQCYATSAPLNLPKVDTRYGSSLREKAPYVEWLGIPENPYGSGWAADKNYGYDIVNRTNQLASTTVSIPKASVTSFNIPNDYYLGTQITGSASATSPNGVLYRFFAVDKSTGTWNMLHDYSTSNSFSWTPLNTGAYMLVVQVKDKYSSSEIDQTITKDITVKDNKATVTDLKIPSDYYIGVSITGSASATSPNGVLYRFFAVDKSTGTWDMLQNYGTSNSFSWTPTKIGSYMLVVQVKDKQSSYQVDQTFTKDITVKDNKATVTDFNIPSDYYIGVPITGNASAISPNGVLYRFFAADKSTGAWNMLKDYSTSNSFNWTPTKIGSYMLVVQVKDKQSSYQVDQTFTKDITVKDNKAIVTDFNIPSDCYIGISITGSASATSPNGVLYRFFAVDKSTGTWDMLQNYGTSNSFNWTPTKIGSYMLVVQVKDKQSSYQVDQTFTKDITVKDNKAIVTNFNIPSYYYIGVSITGSASATSPNGVLYRFFAVDKSTGTWDMLQNYGTSNSFSWKPTKIGSYMLVVQVKDKQSSYQVDQTFTKDITVKDAKATVTGFYIPDNYTTGVLATGSASAVSPYGVLYRFFSVDKGNGTWNIIQDYSTSNTFSWMPTKSGSYMLVVQVRDKQSNYQVDQTSAKDIYVKSIGIKGKVIVIDPGHNYGGDDGAYSTINGTTYVERNLNMQLALKLKAELEKQGATIILTRQESDRSTDEVTPSLQKRVDIANNANADLFISLHHDSSADASKSGISLHYSTYKPGIDTSGIDSNGKDPNGWYNGVNIDTTPSKAAVVSRDLANKLVDGLSRALGYDNLKAHDHNLFVTVNTNMPAILIENGFISNQNEAQRCANSNQQTTKSQTIAKIVNDYFLLNS